MPKFSPSPLHSGSNACSDNTGWVCLTEVAKLKLADLIPRHVDPYTYDFKLKPIYIDKVNPGIDLKNTRGCGMAIRFKLGDLVVMQNGTVFTEYNGFPAVIVDGGRYRRAMNMITMEYDWDFLYRVKVLKEVDDLTMANWQLCVRPWQIRPLRDSNESGLMSEVLDIPAEVPNDLENR
jgi:hypothetical protein